MLDLCDKNDSDELKWAGENSPTKDNNNWEELSTNTNLNAVTTKYGCILQHSKRNVKHELQNKDECIPSNRKKEHMNTPPKIDNLKTDSNIDSCHHSIQEDQKSFELKRVGDRDHETFTKKCEEQPRESFALRIIEKKCQRLEKEENDTTNLCENHECYEWKWAGEHINMKYMTNCEEPSLFRKLEIDKLEHDYNIQTSKNKSNTDCTLNVDTWDNNMKVKSDERDDNTFD